MNLDMQQAVDFLYATPKFTTKNSLDHTRDLLYLLGDPCRDRKIIHVAGSNGKGSVCSFLYHILLQAGKKTALFTSPHLVRINERFRVNGEEVSDARFLQAFHEVKQAASLLEQKSGRHPTFFEFIFAMGMVIFELSDAEYIILETGLGGRLDATNSIRCPILTVITSISLEHTEILGDTLALIAGEKAGILKKQVPVVFDRKEEESASVILQRADQLACPCIGVPDQAVEICEIHKNAIDFCLSTDYDRKTIWQIPFSAVYQGKNAALAITAARVLNRMGYVSELTDPIIQDGLQATRWPGRMQEILPDIYLDGAHNTSGITSFVQAVRELSGKDPVPPLLLFSMVKDKDYRTCIRILTEEIPWKAIAVSVIPGDRGIPYQELEDLLERDADCPVSGFEDYREALSYMRQEKQEGQKLFCTGSLYFIGALMELFENRRKQDDRF